MSNLKKANNLFKIGNYHEALKLYEKLILENPSFYEHVRVNVKFAKSKFESIQTNNFQKQEIVGSHQNEILSKNLKVGVVLHVYHEEVVSEIIEKLKLIDKKFELFITTPLGVNSYSIKELLASFPDARYFKIPNKGRDVFPFFKIFNEFEHCNIVLKIHTKKGVTNYGDIWRGLSLDSLLHSSEYINEIISKLHHEPETVIAGPEIFYGSGRRLMYGNHDNILKICENINLEYKEVMDWGFFAGTMFWFKPEIYKVLARSV